MEKLGNEILSCNIQNVTDEHGLITDLGMDNTSKIRKDASIAKAKANKEVAVAQAEADREANDARVRADRDIAEKQNELAIQKARLKTIEDTERAKADAAYHIQEQEQQRTVLEAETRAKTESVHVREQELAAEVKKRAEADKYKEIQAAEAAMEAEKRRAEANVYAAEQEARAVKLRGEAEAEAIRAKGIAEAEAIRAKGQAEAAALEKRAEALQKMNQAGMAEMMIKVLPEVAAAVAQPLASIDSVSVYDAGSSEGESGISRISGAMPVVIKQVFDTMSDATGVDMREVMRASTYDAAVNHNVHVEGEIQ